MKVLLWHYFQWLHVLLAGLEWRFTTAPVVNVPIVTAYKSVLLSVLANQDQLLPKSMTKKKKNTTA